jgi:anti-sigma regulatory factor (Ser/Thr protein kinase)
LTPPEGGNQSRRDDRYSSETREPEVVPRRTPDARRPSPTRCSAPPPRWSCPTRPQPTRGAARTLENTTSTGAFDIDDVILAVSEAVTNALIHGVRPVSMRLWTAPDRIIAAISDHGSGPADPFAGLLPTEGSNSGGMGPWMAHQVCDHLTYATTEDGFTITLRFDARAGR